MRKKDVMHALLSLPFERLLSLLVDALWSDSCQFYPCDVTVIVIVDHWPLSDLCSGAPFKFLADCRSFPASSILPPPSKHECIFVGFVWISPRRLLPSYRRLIIDQNLGSMPWDWNTPPQINIGVLGPRVLWFICHILLRFYSYAFFRMRSFLCAAYIKDEQRYAPLSLQLLRELQGGCIQ